MNRLLDKGQKVIESGNLPKAIRCYKKAIKRKHLAWEERSIAFYMLAYIHLLSEHQSRHSEMSILGLDLRWPYFHAYNKAAHYLQLIDKNFDPESYGLPLIDQFDQSHLQEVTEDC